MVKLRILKGGKNMSIVIPDREEQIIKICYMANIKKMAQNVIKRKGLTEEDLRKSLRLLRNEK